MSLFKLIEFQVMCQRQGIEVPEVVTRARAMIEALNLSIEAPKRRVLDMSVDDAREYAAELSIRKHATASGREVGLEPGIKAAQDQVWNEMREEIAPELERIVAEVLRPRFDEVAAPIVAGARDFGFTYATTSDELVRRGTHEATDMWRQVGEAWKPLYVIARFRTKISELLEVSPSPRELRVLSGAVDDGITNWSVCFAAGDNWSLRTGYHVEDKPVLSGLDWLAMARDGLRLNTPMEVRQKLAERQAAIASRQAAAPTNLSTMQSHPFGG